MTVPSDPSRAPEEPRPKLGDIEWLVGQMREASQECFDLRLPRAGWLWSWVASRLPALLDADADRQRDGVSDLEESAWGIIANAGGSDWTTQTVEWQKAAARWRSRYHKALDAARSSSPTTAGPGETT